MAEEVLNGEQKKNIHNMLLNKINDYESVICNTYVSMNYYKNLKIVKPNDTNHCINELNMLLDEVRLLQIYLKDNEDNYDVDNIINDIQVINNKLSSIIKTNGTKNIRDLINICFGQDYLEKTDDKYETRISLIEQYFHPISYKLIQHNDKKKNNTSSSSSNPILQDIRICEKGENFTFYDLENINVSSNLLKIYGMRILIQEKKNNKSLLISGFVDDIQLDYIIGNKLILEKCYKIKENKPNSEEFFDEKFDLYLKTLNMKDYLINDNNELYDRYIGYLNNARIFKTKSLNKIVNDFIKASFVDKRLTLIQLLLFSNDNEYQYMAYLLYDSISTDDKVNDSTEQIFLFDSLPWSIKNKFKGAMKQTLEYTNNLLNYDVNNKLPLEQRICLLKTSDKVKEKAMLKLKEVKSKTDDSGTKARHYIDGLLKIPFGIFKRETIFDILDSNETAFRKIIEKDKYSNLLHVSKKSAKYTSMEIIKNINSIYSSLSFNDNESKMYILMQRVEKLKKKELYDCLHILKGYMKDKEIVENNDVLSMYVNMNWQNQNRNFLKEKIIFMLKEIEKNYPNLLDEVISATKIIEEEKISLYNELKLINNNTNMVSTYMNNVKNILDSSVYGHDSAKRQVERIIGQWINGKETGYSLGFEGPPGVGKCLAKDTPIMLSNGKIKMVQDITLKDKLMGDDGFERNVLALGSGREKMYRIEQVKGDDYVVNESHILSLKMSKAGRKGDKHQTILGKRYYKDDIVDICIKDYLGLPKYLKECLKGYKVGLDFREQEVLLEPYAIGYWLGDGDKTTFRITTIENEVVEYFTKYASENGLQITKGKEGTKNDITYHITTGIKGGNNYKRNSLLNSLKQYNLINNKHIPQEYKLTTRENRLFLLAGLVDSDGYYNPKNNSLEITQKNKLLADDIVFLVRSLGMRAMIKECNKSCTYKGKKKYGIYHRITISGSGLDEIPVLLERKKARPNNQKKNCLNTGIKIVPLEEDKYYGFQIDGNSRFLLGDFTVTHNTSLAKKGLADCLVDDNGESRPFSFIAIGGSSNGSTLEGHNYTYVGSTWGRIVDILMEKKCMNPIIFIDEIDKVSRTESGREIISILTHLIDPTQNDNFQDKYFSGVELDLSKVLFVFSYNDVELIDKILLDRIHRIKFDHLTLDDKLVICEKHMLPEIYENMGQNGTINIDEEVLKYIIEHYTYESGVRKLKEILNEIIGEINLELLKNTNVESLPINVTKDDVKYKYLKKRHEIREKEIHKEHEVGIINGLWANSLGKGGIIPIQSQFILSTNLLDLKLTGMQGDVMKESMTVAKTLAWKLISDENKTSLLEQFEKTKTQGIHIHCPDGATPKDGPSAGTAITITLYSLFTNKKIRHNLAITGEMNLQGQVTAIGGLDLKILGGMRAGVKTFLYPVENKKDYEDFLEKYGHALDLSDINFHSIETIEEAISFAILDE